ncbi:unnamed protein product [Phytophthora fragariaefolia]|uniref:Unnamed protein product n=1 Tax=Phytophthora fragariaefolia TaxID=1490495 RepID=A0A9W7CR74_9STRA|nr:unnamed protein product [Phytophthora fragariaefolia]
MTEDWYDEERPSLIGMSFHDTGEALVRRFRTKRTDKQVMAEIGNARQKTGGDVRQFANRLKRIASLLKDGPRAERNARIVLHTFCERAYPAKQESPEHAIKAEATEPLIQLERALEHLTKLADSGGSIDQTCKREPPTSARDWKTKRQRTATANVAAKPGDITIIDRKDKNTKRGSNQAQDSCFAHFVCWICKDANRPSQDHNHHHHPDLFEETKDSSRSECVDEHSA